MGPEWARFTTVRCKNQINVTPGIVKNSRMERLVFLIKHVRSGYLRGYRNELTALFCFLCFNFAVNGQAVDGSYFPVPKKSLTIVQSESQAFMVDTVLQNLTRPWSMVFLPNKIILITERSGKLLMVKNGKLQNLPVGGNVPKGLRDIKLHPDYKKNGWIYLSYYIEPVEKAGGTTVLMRARLKNDKLVDTSILYRAGPFRLNGEWYGSKIAFDRKGFLYFTVGIRGARINAQDKSKHDGKTMRLNDDGTVPKDNPFVDSVGVLPEIYTYGHRMHEGLTRHPETGEIWSTEFGEKGGDEINIIKAGANYGWPEVTFSTEYSGAVLSKDLTRSDIQAPVHHFSISPSDLEFLTGERYPGWKGSLFVGSLPKRLLNRSVLKGNSVIHDEQMLENIGRVRDVKVGPDNYLYLLMEDVGIMVRLLPVTEK